MINQSSLYGDELLVAALAQVESQSTFRLKNESRVIQELYRISRRKKFKSLFKNYPFDTDGIEPYSAVISEGMDSLQQSRLLGRQNPDLIVYTISPAIKRRYDRFIAPKLEGNENLIKQLGEALSKALEIQPPGVSQNEPNLQDK